MPTNQLAPPDMPWLTGGPPMRPNGLGPPMLNYAAPPPDASTSQGAAIADTGQTAWQWLQDQRAESVRQGLLDPDTGLPTQAGIVQGARDTAQGVMMGTTAPGEVPPPGIVAYHGSPADFNRFSDDFIGTGEGAQAYGRGHYFGGAEQTAINYRDQLSSPTTPDQLAAHYLAAMGGNRGQAMAQLQHNATFDQPPADAAALLQAHELLKSGATPNPTPAGHMYQVNIAADPEHFLDWDKPFSEQSQHVQDALTKAQGAPYHGQNLSGSDYAPSSPEAAQQLRDAGIPGIKYLDQGSRATAFGEHIGTEQTPQGWQAKIRTENRGGGAGGFQAPTSIFTTSPPFPTKAAADAWAQDKIGNATHNYVVFDPATIEILRKYGLAGLIAGGGAAAAGTQQQQPSQ